jgi:hypothetical protein
VRFPATRDRSVAASLRALPDVAAGEGAGAREMFARAELHGVAGVIWDAWKSKGVPIDPALASRLEAAAIARELDHGAHLDILRRIDARLVVPTVALKGPLFARRYYPRPSARGTSDVDVLVAEHDIDATVACLAPLGYEVVDSLREIARSRREHHHLHLASPRSPNLELHFHAYRGFGVTLRTETLAERSVPADGFRMLRVPSAADELVYLAVHAASHRFGRLAWLYDLRLIVDRMSPADLETAATRARAWGVGRVLALAGDLLVEVFGARPETVRPLGALPLSRRALVHAVVGEPRTRILSSATRFAYTTMLADSMSASFRYAKSSSVGHARRVLGLD